MRTNWFRVRLIVLGICALIGLLDIFGKPSEFRPEMDQDVTWILWILPLPAAGLPFAVMAAMVRGILVIQTDNPYGDRRWALPRHDSNPLHFRNPLLFFHFAGYCFLAYGLGLLVAVLRIGYGQLIEALIFISAGLGVLAGLAWTIASDPTKIEQPIRQAPSPGDDRDKEPHQPE